MSSEIIAAYFDEHAATWDTHAESFGNKHLMVAQLAGVGEGCRVLDVGCGTGIMSQAYLELGAGSVVGIDLSSEMIEVACRKFSGMQAEHLKFECADVIRLEGEQIFDAIVLYNCYPHILDKDALVQSCARLLVSGGRFLVAHGFGRRRLNNHHFNVPSEVTSELHSAKDECEAWKPQFEIDLLGDTPYLYFFGGVLR